MEFYQTDRLVVRQFSGSDAAQLFSYLYSPTVNCFADEKLATMEEALLEASRKQQDPTQFAVCLNDHDLLIGHLFAIEEGDTYNIGWNFNPAYQGKGFAKEAAKGLFNYLFYEKSARRIYCYVEDDNLPSQKLCERLGMRKEGLFEEYISFINDSNGNPIYVNTLQYALLKRNWQEAK
ncbi:GNAT family N-acetyltransferase [Mucilaginibacter sp. 21P]|uniref:GNAT family N-acetyltransferase n=1 Tax=Mucilaginibacter sp. 21P TaxID=2778902 RepID=UPI001C55D793|nr:GNAT family protein [Mucilaginibacter sp. 21P]QXV66859.1 GNAT family N-acetyltransferase [Mucilaginibacter sp. 21P]